MAVIENAASPEAFAQWRRDMQAMAVPELIAQQLVQRGAEHALDQLLKIGASDATAKAMLDSVRCGLMTIEEVAHERGVDLVGYQAP